MSTDTFVRHTRIDAPAEFVFRWHMQPGSLKRLTPPWIHMKIPGTPQAPADGTRVSFTARSCMLPWSWEMEHGDCIAGRQFRTVQRKGPFASWEHTHRFEPDGENACYLEDRVEYSLPYGPIGHMVNDSIVHDALERLFIYRHRIVKHDIAIHRASRAGRMRLLVTGSHGLIGSALIPFLQTAGHEVNVLVRSEEEVGAHAFYWNAVDRIDEAALEGHDAIIHLAGENIASFRWTAEKKARIRESRVRGTRLLCEAVARLKQPPKTLLAASSTGIYGNRGGELLHEESLPGRGFLPEVCREWEGATAPASEKRIRVVNLRFGVVLSPAGGLLAMLLPPFLGCAGATIGTGWEYMNWITPDDAIGAIYHALTASRIKGPVNVVAPYTVTSRDFARTLGRVLGRPALLRVPAFAARLALGEMGDETILVSARVEPRELLDSGYVFCYPEIEGALRHVLGRT